MEAHNPLYEMFGFPRLKTLVEDYANEASLIDILLNELKSFTGDGWEQEDDLTLVELQRLPAFSTKNEQYTTLPLLQDASIERA